MQIIPAIDIIDGKCVRLTEGDYSQKKIYNEHPLEVAKEFEGAGLQRLHLVDLDGAKAGAVKNWKVLETITSKTSLIIDFGGGIKQEEDVKIVLNSGAALATAARSTMSTMARDLPLAPSRAVMASGTSSPMPMPARASAGRCVRISPSARRACKGRKSFPPHRALLLARRPCRPIPAGRSRAKSSPKPSISRDSRPARRGRYALSP